MKFFAYFACVDSAGAKGVREHTVFREICGFFHVDSENIVIEIVDIKRPSSEQRLL